MPAGNVSCKTGCRIRTNDFLKKLSHNGCIFRRDGLPANLITIIKNHIAIAVFYIIIGIGFIVSSAVSKNLETSRHFTHRHAHTAANAHGKDLIARGDGIKPQSVYKKSCGRLRCNRLQQTNGRWIQRLDQSIACGHFPFKPRGIVVRTRPAIVKISLNRLVKQKSRIVDQSRFEGGRVIHQRFDGGTGLAHSHSGIVPHSIAFLFSNITHNSKHTAGIVHGKIAKLRTGIQRIQNSGIRKDAFRNLLIFRILRRINFQPIVINHINGLIGGNVVKLHQVVFHVFKQCIRVPVPNRNSRIVIIGRICVPDKCHMLRFFHGLLIFPICDNTLIVHFGQNCLLTCFVGFRMQKRIIFIGVLRNAGYSGTLSQITILNVFPKIEICRRLHPVAAAAKVHHVQISCQNYIFGIFFFQIQSAENFRDFSRKAHIAIACQIFNKLLCNGRAAVHIAVSGEQIQNSTCRANPINAVMFPETFIFNADNRIFHVFRYLCKINPHTVFAAVKSLVFYRIVGIIALSIHINKRGIIQLQLI